MLWACTHAISKGSGWTSSKPRPWFLELQFPGCCRWTRRCLRWACLALQLPSCCFCRGWSTKCFVPLFGVFKRLQLQRLARPPKRPWFGSWTAKPSATLWGMRAPSVVKPSKISWTSARHNEVFRVLPMSLVVEKMEMSEIERMCFWPVLQDYTQLLLAHLAFMACGLEEDGATFQASGELWPDVLSSASATFWHVKSWSIYRRYLPRQLADCLQQESLDAGQNPGRTWLGPCGHTRFGMSHQVKSNSDVVFGWQHGNAARCIIMH